MAVGTPIKCSHPEPCMMETQWNAATTADWGEPRTN